MRLKVILSAVGLGLVISMFFAYADDGMVRAVMYFFIGLILLLIGYWFYLGAQRMKLHAFFWRFMPEDDKELINGGIENWPFSPSKKERALIRKRNYVLMKFDRERAKRFIITERKWVVLPFAIIFLLIALGLLWCKIS